MKTVRLPELVNIEYGCAFDSHQFNSESRGLPLVRIRDVVRGQSNTYFDGEFAERYVVRDGDLLIGMDGEFNLGIWAGGEALLNQRVCRLGASDESIDRGYLRWFMPRALKDIEAATPFVTVKHLSAKALNAIEVPLPPLEEQRRIAAILDQADAIRAKRNAVTLALETLIRSTFDEMFSLGNWPRETLAELTECLDSKRRPVTAKDRPSGDVPYFGANNQQGWIDTPIFDEPLILVAEDGGWFETPEKGVAYRIDGPAWVNNHAHVLRAKPELETEYLHRVLKHFDFRPYISGSTRSKLNQKQLMSVTIPLPPLALQQEFAAKVQQIEQQRRLVEAALERDNELFASLQERAFSGGL